ncbi:MAG: glycosyltransferase family 2 protein [Bacteroidota bacterium]
MKVSGFSFIRNAEIYDYPIVEAITSVLPLVDEFIVAVGKSEDNTEALIRGINSPKIKILNTVWDDNMRSGGRVLAQETDKALAEVSVDSDWAIYIQGDEVLHEDGIKPLREAMEKYKNDLRVEGILLRYRHFYGSYNYIADSRNWYRREIRVVRTGRNIVSYRDAQGFRNADNRKLNVKSAEVYMYHYGWVKSLPEQRRKLSYFGRFWHSDDHMKLESRKAENFKYESVDSVKEFTGTHPAVMLERIKRHPGQLVLDTTRKNMRKRRRLLMFVEERLGLRFGEYKNYKLI